MYSASRFNASFLYLTEYLTRKLFPTVHFQTCLTVNCLPVSAFYSIDASHWYESRNYRVGKCNKLLIYIALLGMEMPAEKPADKCARAHSEANNCYIAQANCDHQITLSGNMQRSTLLCTDAKSKGSNYSLEKRTVLLALYWRTYLPCLRDISAYHAFSSGPGSENSGMNRI